MFIAKYTYDPSLFSPNTDHDLELPLCAGDRVYVYGDVDEVRHYLHFAIVYHQNKVNLYTLYKLQYTRDKEDTEETKQKHNYDE